MINILFQGDSITDAGRSRTTSAPNIGLGHGYPTMISGMLSSKRNDLNFYNRGNGGNRISDIYGRWLEDAVNMDFDVISILAGINDVGFQLRLGRGSDNKRFRFIYDRMLYEIKESHPDAKIMLLEPFVIKYRFDWEPYGTDIYDNYETWAQQTREKGAVVSELAKEYDAVFVPLFDKFLSAIGDGDPSRYTEDCVHPTAIGHSIIAKEWLTAWDTLNL